MSRHSIIIIGSGPAGVSAAFPLVNAGCEVLMLDAGIEAEQASAFSGNFLDFKRTAKTQHHVFYGKNQQALLAPKSQSPKLRVPQHQYVYRDFHDRYHVNAKNFQLTGSLARGGLANAWGAVCYTYTKNEIKLSDRAYHELRYSYQNIASRIGVSGPPQDDLSQHFERDIHIQPKLPLHPRSQFLLKRYESHTFTGFQLGQPRSAVLSVAKGNRAACRLDNRCLWGCEAGSIYQASFDVESLKKFSNFKYLHSLFLQKIVKCTQGYQLLCQSLITGENVTLTTETLIMAAGTVGTTALVLDFMQAFYRPVKLQSNPCLAMAFVLPKYIGSTITEKAFGMGQLGFHLALPKFSIDAIGTLYAAESLLSNEWLGFMPFTKKNSISLARHLMPAMMLANCFLPGVLSGHSLHLSKTPEGSQLNIRGGVSDDFFRIKKSLLFSLVSALRRCGAWYLPFSCKIPLPGSDVHYAVTLPMSDEAMPLTVNQSGQLFHAENFYIVDGSILPVLPSKNLTFTIMANADRIGRFIARAKKKDGRCIGLVNTKIQEA